MAKLYFKYGAMGSSKTAQALITKFNYEERGMRVWLIKPSIDNRDGADAVKSRIGLYANAYVVTPDKDYAQLVDDNIKMLRITHGNGLELMDKKMVCEKWGIDDPSKIIDLLALMGDASDNIPGCKGVGEKTAVKLLQEFGSVESVIENSESIKGALKTKVQESTEMIKFSKILVTICTDVPIETPISDLAIKEKKVDEMLKIFNDLELKSFITKYTQKSAPVQLSLFDNFSTITQAEEK